MRTVEISYKNFDAIITLEGVIIVSKMGTDYPVVILNNRSFGFVVYLSDEVNYSLQFSISVNEIDVRNMATYHAVFNEKSTWLVSIPYSGHALNVSNHFKSENMISIQKQFKPTDFPESVYELSSIAIITGFCE